MENETYQFTPSGFLRIITIIHFALIFGVVAFGGILYLLSYNPTLNWNESGEVFFYAVPILAVVCVLFGNILYKSRLDKLKEVSNLRDKLMEFQTASIIKYALLEGATLFSLVAFLQMNNLLYLLIAGVLVVYNLFQRPTKERIINDLKLEGALKDQFNDMRSRL